MKIHQRPSHSLSKKKIRLNSVIALLTLSDIFTWGFFGILSILTGVYLSEKLGADTPQFVGLGTSIYLFVRAISQLPFGKLIDTVERDADEIVLLAVGNFCMGLPFIFYPSIRSPLDYYLLQMVFGLGTSMNLVSWRKLFAKNLDSNREGSEYGTYETFMSAIGACIALVAGSIANIGPAYFNLVFYGIGLIMMASSISAFGLFFIRDRKAFDDKSVQ